MANTLLYCEEPRGMEGRPYYSCNTGSTRGAATCEGKEEQSEM